MDLKKLLENVRVLGGNADADTKINDVKSNSNEVREGDLFVCMKGGKEDAWEHLGDIRVPFVALTDRAPSDPAVRYVLTDDVRLAYAQVCKNRFLDPLADMKLISVVGTNGKTSTAHYIASILAYAGIKCGVIGTEGHYILGQKVGESLTTPDPYEFYELLFRMRAKGCEAVVSEVSAHAIHFKKLGDAVADIAVLTNISQDHLDFFGTFEKYAETKLSYFTSEHVVTAVVNADDPFGGRIMREAEARGIEALGYGLYEPADCFAVNVREDMDGIGFVCNLQDDIAQIRSRLYGEFNVYNLLAALSVGHAMGLDARTLAQAAVRIKPVKGRFSVLRCEKGNVIIDFAHTPEGLKSLLSTARTLTKSRLITVFGCGGERDRSKRRVMGEVASKYSDSIVLTSDNPRGEDPRAIIEDIESGVCIKDCKVIVDRQEAVRYALSEMEEGDTLVLAGKGNESYLEVKGKKLPYSDFDAVARFGQLR